jgi:hypothetical protein
MKTLLKFVLVTSCFLLNGCVPIATKHPLADGYSIETINHFLAVEPGGGRELHFRSPRGTQKLIWKYVPGNVVVTNRTAVFIGDWDGTDEYAGYTFFSVNQNGPVIRLRKAILARAAQKDGAQLGEYLKRYGDSELTQKDNMVRFLFSCRIGTNNPDLIVNLTWSEISEIVDMLVKTGKSHKDKLNGITYLE